MPMVIWMTSGTFVELGEIQKRGAFENIGSEARCNIVVNYTNDGSKLTNLELTGEDNAEGDAVFLPAKKKAKKAKITAAEETQRHSNAGSIATRGANIAAHTGRNGLP